MKWRIVAGTVVLGSSLTGCMGVGKADPVPSRTGSVTMPNLVGENAATARDELKQLGFAGDRIKLSPQGHLFVAMPTHWSVADQSEPPGTQVSFQRLIVLTVVKDR